MRVRGEQLDEPRPTSDDPRQLDLFTAAAERAPPTGGGGGSGGTDDPRPGHLAEAADAYVTFQASIGRSRHTLRATRVDLGALARFLGDPPLEQVTTGDLQRFLADGALRGKPAPRSQRRKTANLKVFFRHARAEGWIDRDPATRLVYAGVDARAPVFLSEEELDRLVLAAARNVFWQAAVLAMADAGLKRDELLALEVADVYLDPLHPERSYLVVRQADRAKKIRARRLALTPRLAAALRRVIDERGSRVGRVFGVTPAAVNFMLESLTALAGLARVERVTPQMLRETFAVRAAGRFVEAEAAEAARGRPEEELRALRIEHDVALSELLGLSTDDPANLALVGRKYRRLAGPAADRAGGGVASA
jgi:integrase